MVRRQIPMRSGPFSIGLYFHKIKDIVLFEEDEEENLKAAVLSVGGKKNQSVNFEDGTVHKSITIPQDIVDKGDTGKAHLNYTSRYW